MIFLRRAVATMVLLAFFGLGILRPASAWWAAGHAVIAMMAYRQMKPETRKAVDQTLQAHPDYKNWLAELPANVTPAQKGEYVFAIASTWADRIKDSKDQTVSTKFYEPGDTRNPSPPGPRPVASAAYPDLNAHGKWHYYDVPINADGKDRPAPSEESILTALPLCRGNIAATNLPASYRAYYLAWLVHLVGDIHQPLHTASRFSAANQSGDGGGNGVRFKTDPNPANAGAPRNLHAFWDALLGSGPDPKRYNSLLNGWEALNATIAAVEADEPRLLAGFDPQTRNSLDEKQWLRESFAVAQDFVYTFGDVDAASVPPPGSDYQQQAMRVAHQRAALAAHRLALICDDAFAAKPK